MRRHLIASLISVLVVVLGVEGMLRAFDPLGVVFYDDYAAMRRASSPADHGYTIAEGVHHARHWTYTILADGTRLTPARNEDGPNVTFVGDSVTFGHGVNDKDVWVSHVADALGLNAANAGRSVYSAVNVSLLLREVEGCAVFLTFPNDPAHQDFPQTSYYDTRSYTSRVAILLRTGKPTVIPQPFNAGFDAAMQEIAARPDTLIVAFDDSYGRAVEAGYGVRLIPWYSDRVSYVDAHADVKGNLEIAEAITPVIEQWLSTRSCQ
jgi:hypothetical protein